MRIFDGNLAAIENIANGLEELAAAREIFYGHFAPQYMLSDKMIHAVQDELTSIIMIALIPLSNDDYLDFAALLENTGRPLLKESLTIALSRDKVIDKLYEKVMEIKGWQQAANITHTNKEANDEIDKIKTCIADIIADNWSWIREYAIFINYSDDRLVAVAQAERWPEEVQEVF